MNHCDSSQGSRRTPVATLSEVREAYLRIGNSAASARMEVA